MRADPSNPTSLTPAPSERAPLAQTTAHVRFLPLDPGWLFLAASLALIGAVVLIPAQRDVAQARLVRDRALALEQHRLARLDRYEGFLAAVADKDPGLMRDLLATQLNQMPAEFGLITGPAYTRVPDASVFPALEPPPPVLPTANAQTNPTSLLGRWATNPRARLWLIALGGVGILIGMMPPARPRTEPAID